MQCKRTHIWAQSDPKVTPKWSKKGPKEGPGAPRAKMTMRPPKNHVGSMSLTPKKPDFGPFLGGVLGSFLMSFSKVSFFVEKEWFFAK